LFQFQAGVDPLCPGSIDGSIGEFVHSPKRFETPNPSQTTTGRPLEGEHQKAVDLSRKRDDSTTI
jgi:hypothetical protein